MFRVGIAGAGMVGGSLMKCFKDPIVYDKHRKIGTMKDLDKADIIFICVPSGDVKEGFSTDIIEEILDQMSGEKVVVIKSTVVPFTTQRLQDHYSQHKFLFNPEFLTEETADADAKYPDRQIVGYTDKSYNVALDVMGILPIAPCERVVPSYVAEFIKYYGNSWFADKVAFNNQMFELATQIGLKKEEWDQVIDGVSADKRIGRSHLNVWHKGFRGYGGKCLPKDSKAIIEYAKDRGVELSILKEVDKYNDALTGLKVG